MMEDPKSLYQVARNLPGEVTLHLMKDAETEEERKFWVYIYTMNLQRSQKIAIENNWF